ncbi:hypothetical protein D3C86_577750 [compost metagenome]
MPRHQQRHGPPCRQQHIGAAAFMPGVGHRCIDLRQGRRQNRQALHCQNPRMLRPPRGQRRHYDDGPVHHQDAAQARARTILHHAKEVKPADRYGDHAHQRHPGEPGEAHGQARVVHQEQQGCQRLRDRHAEEKRERPRPAGRRQAGIATAVQAQPDGDAQGKESQQQERTTPIGWQRRLQKSAPAPGRQQVGSRSDPHRRERAARIRLVGHAHVHPCILAGVQQAAQIHP